MKRVTALDFFSCFPFIVHILILFALGSAKVLSANTHAHSTSMTNCHWKAMGYIEDNLINQDSSDYEALLLIVEEGRKGCPMDLGDGMVMTDYRLEKGMLITEITVSEKEGEDFVQDLIDMQDLMRQNLINGFIEGKDADVKTLMDLLVSTNNNMGFLYKSLTTGKELLLVLYQSDLQSILKKTKLNSLEILRQEIENVRASCPNDLGNNMVMTDYRLEKDGLVTEITMDEDYFSIEELMVEASMLKQEIINNLKEGQDPDVIDLLKRLVETKNKYIFEYKGSKSGKSFRTVLTVKELKQIINSK